MFIGFSDGARKAVEAASFLLLHVLRTETLVVISASPGTYEGEEGGNDSAIFFHNLKKFLCVSLLVCVFHFVSIIAWNTVLMCAKYL